MYVKSITICTQQQLRTTVYQYNNYNNINNNNNNK